MKVTCCRIKKLGVIRIKAVANLRLKITVGIRSLPMRKFDITLSDDVLRKYDDDYVFTHFYGVYYVISSYMPTSMTLCR